MTTLLGNERLEAPKPSSPRLERVHVQLAVSPLGPQVSRMQAYHTSVLADGVEYAFSGRGLTRGNGTPSHEARVDAGATTLIDMGVHDVDLQAFFDRLTPHFRSGTYDLLLKNCNSFTDVALFYLTGRRLERRYRSAEQIARVADRCASVVQALSDGAYRQNPRAVDFDATALILELAPEKAICLGIPFAGGSEFWRGLVSALI